MPFIARPAAGQIIDPAWGTLVADAVVMRFTTAAQRSSQLVAPVTGQLTMVDDRAGVIQRWSGSAWLDMPQTLERFVATPYGGQVTAGSPQEISIATFTMPFTGVIIMQGLARWDPTPGAPAAGMNALVDDGPTSVPPAPVHQQWVGPGLPANNYLAVIPFAWKWTAVTAGTAVNLKIKYSTNAAYANLTHVAVDIRVLTGEL